jgi:hypothetical protein
MLITVLAAGRLSQRQLGEYEMKRPIGRRPMQVPLDELLAQIDADHNSSEAHYEMNLFD